MCVCVCSRVFTCFFFSNLENFLFYSKQYLSHASFQCFLTFVAYVTADIGLTAGQNQYLPPPNNNNNNNGYNYQKPNIPFGSAPAPQTVE